jgi:hypothetical protein
MGELIRVILRTWIDKVRYRLGLPHDRRMRLTLRDMRPNSGRALPVATKRAGIVWLIFANTFEYSTNIIEYSIDLVFELWDNSIVKRWKERETQMKTFNEIAQTFRPYHAMPAFQKGAKDWKDGQYANPFNENSVEAQAWDRGALATTMFTRQGQG